MATFTSLSQYRKVLQNRIKELRRQKNFTERDAAELMKVTAKRLAPRKTGATITGIRKRKTTNGWKVESTVPGLFKQNLFANQTAPFRTLRIRKNTKFFAGDQAIVYGRPAKSPTGKPINWTGMPQFFHFATLRTREKFRKIAVKNTRKALRVNIG